MPLTFGGRIRTLEDIEARLAAGADKVVINTAAFDDPALVEAAARRFGIAVRRGAHRCPAPRRRPLRGVRRRRHGDRPGCDPAEWARGAERRGAGEIFLNSIDRDGSGAGYDLDLIRARRRRGRRSRSWPAAASAATSTSPAAIEAGAARGGGGQHLPLLRAELPVTPSSACLEAGIPMRPVGLGSRFLAARARLRPRPREDARIAGAWPTRRRAISAARADAAPSGGRSAGARVRLPVDQRGADGVRRQRRVHRLPRWRTVKAAIAPRRMDAPPRAAARPDRALPLPRRQPPRLRHPGQRRQGQLVPGPRHQARVRSQPAARHLRRQQLDRRRLAQHACA